MKLMLHTLALIAMCSTSTVAQTIGVYSDQECSTCPLSLDEGETTVFYVAAVPTDPFGFSAAEFRVLGLPDGWTYTLTPNPSATLVLGDPLGPGTGIGFPAGQNGCTVLFSVEITASSQESDVLLEVAAHATPANANLNCAWIDVACSPCDIFICVDTSPLWINGGDSCAVSVEHSTWGKVKQRYVAP